MRRREFIARSGRRSGVAGGAAGPASEQHRANRVLGGGVPTQSNLRGSGSRANIALEYRWAEGSYARLPELAAELTLKCPLGYEQACQADAH
jgi:hypothetical protein